MAADKRRKACPNLTCKRYKKDYKYKATDNFCTICGTELVYVCVDCLTKIESASPEEKYCEACAKKHEDQKEKVKAGAEKVKQVAAAGVAAAPKIVELAKDEKVIGFVKKGAKLIVRKK